MSMEKVMNALKELNSVNEKYNIDTKEIDKMREEMSEARVCTPIIGKFSSGKSALVNTVLGCRTKILREDITPETAIPAEIVYSELEDKITLICNDGTCKQLSVDEYRTYEADANAVKRARIQLRNSVLKEIPDVMIVDMPGFESGFEIHNRAIDDYLPQSLAYIIAFPADDMIVRSSVGNILKELCLHDMPLCVVITKCDKKNDDFDVTFQKMKESLRRFVGDREIRYCMTSSFKGDAEELEEFLKEIQDKSQELLANKYKKLLMSLVDNTQNYLAEILNGSQLSESQLDEEEDKLRKQLSTLDSKFSKEQDDFNIEISECAEEIKSDVQRALEAEESTLVVMVLNKQSINDYLNSVVRNTVTVSVKKKFIPKVEKYLKRITKVINSESIGHVNISFTFDTDKLDKEMPGGIVAVVAGLLLGNPILGIIVGAFMKFSGDKKREEAKQSIRQKLRSEVFPQIIREVGNGIDKTITEQIKLVNTSIEEKLTNQRNTLEKAMTDLRQQMNDEKAKRESFAIGIKEDLERIEEIKDGLR